jgi:hypothetical protein
MHPSFEQFDAALRTPERRAAIRLTITDADAASLLTRDDWAHEYYSQWVGMFPPDDPTAVPAASPAQQGGLGVGARVLLVGLVVACIGVATAALIIPMLPGANRAANLTAAQSGSTPSPAATDANGMTAAQAQFVNADLAISNSSISQLIAGGMTQQDLHEGVIMIMGIADLECTQVGKTPAGFDTPGAEDKFVAGLTKGITLLGKTVTPTTVQAEHVWDATVA